MKKNNMNTSILEKRSFSWTSWKSSNLQLISSYLIQRSKSLVNLFFKTLTSSQPQILLTIWGVDFNSTLLLQSTLQLLMVTQLTLALFIMELTAQHNIKQSSIRFGKSFQITIQIKESLLLDLEQSLIFQISTKGQLITVFPLMETLKTLKLAVLASSWKLTLWQFKICNFRVLHISHHS